MRCFGKSKFECWGCGGATIAGQIRGGNQITRSAYRPRRVLAVLVSAAAALVGQVAGAARAGPREEFESLVSEMDVAVAQLLEARAERAAAGEAGEHYQDKRSEILRRMDALADSSAGSSEGAFIAAQTYLLSLDVDRQNALARFQTLLARYSDAADLDQPVEYASVVFRDSGTPDGWIEALDTVASSTKRVETRGGAAFQAAVIRLKLERLASARGAFNEIIKDVPRSEFAELARGYIFEIERLQVGMTAPDFQTETLDGKTITLKSLRGKPIFLNFWASW